MTPPPIRGFPYPLSTRLPPQFRRAVKDRRFCEEQELGGPVSMKGYPAGRIAVGVDAGRRGSRVGWLLRRSGPQPMLHLVEVITAPVIIPDFPRRGRPPPGGPRSFPGVLPNGWAASASSSQSIPPAVAVAAHGAPGRAVHPV